MSTRCQIGFYNKKSDKLKNFQALIYKHSDGYPGTEDGKEYGVLTDIIPFLKWWSKGRGLEDTEYAPARLLQYLANKSDKNSLEFAKEIKSASSDINEEFTGIYGYGICKNFHGDIEFFYKIYPNELEVYDVSDQWDKFNKSGFKLLKTIKI